MLLKKNIKILFAISIVLIIASVSVYAQSEKQTCDVAEIKDALRQALFDYFGSPSSSKLTVNEIKDFLHFYLSTDTSKLAVDCGGSGPFSGKPYYLMLGVAKKIAKDIPKCGDGTEFGKCSSNFPNYCYGGKLEERCKICGCGESQTCDKSTNKCMALSAGDGKKDKAALAPPLNPPTISSINPSSGNKFTKITLTGTGFTSADNSINLGHNKNTIKKLASPDGKTLAFNAPNQDCGRNNSCLVSVTNSKGTSNRVMFNLTKKPKAKKIEHKGKPSVQILSPNGGERYTQGKDKITISWSGGTDKVILALEERGLDWNGTDYYYPYLDSEIIAQNLSPSGSYEWDGMNVCPSLSQLGDCHTFPPGFYKILAISQDKKGQPLTFDEYGTIDLSLHDNWDESDGSFLIVNSDKFSSVEVESPNGEERWIQDTGRPTYYYDAKGVLQQYTEDMGDGTLAPFAFKTSGYQPGSIGPWQGLGQVLSINLLKGGKFYRTMTYGFFYSYYNDFIDNIWYMNFPPDIVTGDDYTVEVVYHNPDGDARDVSDKPFSIGTIPGVVALRGYIWYYKLGWSYTLPNGIYFYSYPTIYPGTRKDGTRFYPLQFENHFNFGMNADDASIGTQKALYTDEQGYFISNLSISLSKKPDNSLEAVAEKFLVEELHQSPGPIRVPIVNSSADFGTIALRLATGFTLITDIPVSYSIEYTQDGLSANGTAPNSKYISDSIALNYDVRVKIIDGAGKVYYSPYINLGLEYTGRTETTLTFKNGELTWNILPNLRVVSLNYYKYFAGTNITIKWEHVNAPQNASNNPVYIYFTSDDYSTPWWNTFYPLVFIASTKGTSYNWTVPSVYAGSGLHRILVTNYPIPPDYPAYYYVYYNYHEPYFEYDYSDDYFWIY